MNEGKEKAIIKLKTARGQLDGIIRMIENDRYCVDISTQIASALAILRKANLDILDGHIRSCVSDAIIEGGEESDKKIEEMVYLIDRFIK